MLVLNVVEVIFFSGSSVPVARSVVLGKEVVDTVRKLVLLGVVTCVLGLRLYVLLVDMVDVRTGMDEL